MINIVTVGDSITQAETGYNSYRSDLWDLLIDAGYDVDFVGSENKTKDNTDFPDNSFDPDHEGHWGWRTDEINDGRSGEGSLEDWLTEYTPDIALVHLGTNDLFQGQSVESTIDDLSETIDILRADNPDVVIFVAELIPTTDPTRNQSIEEFNDQLPTLVADKNQANSPVILVDQNTGFDASQDTYDGIHPDESGEAKVAQQWFVAIDSYLTENPITPAPATGEIGNFVFSDEDEDGRQDVGEDFGVAGITVTLTGAGADGVLGTGDDTTATQVTDANGEYLFTNLAAGDYEVTFSDLPDEIGFSPANGYEDSIDSDADPATGTTPVITLADGESNLTVDAGLVDLPLPLPRGYIGGAIFPDRDDDGYRDSGEFFQASEGISVTVTLTGAGVDGIFGTADDITETQVTNVFHNFAFNTLEAGDYTLTFSDLPTGYRFSPANVGTDEARDSDVDPATGTTEVITLSEGEIISNIGVGLHEFFTPGPGGENILEGTPNNDDLVGTDGDDRLVGFVGIDTLTGNGGNDVFVLGDENGS
ncbi:MAG: hypothetical protein KTR27_17250, partial [Leptolyngbyaceae cyanobacterium MAG.088]|nr:hypothetical protein [Leptolyngbyaceae cyanobacterium MAG.088]